MCIRDRLYNELIASIKKYHPSTDITMIQKAYETAREAHKDQKRKSGEPYIIHPLCVAIILADLEDVYKRQPLRFRVLQVSSLALVWQ